jgi:hypothetical protein
MRLEFRNTIVAALAGALAFSAMTFTPAQAASTTTFSARRHWHHHGNAAVLGAVAGVFGTIGALAARDQYRDEYYGYDDGPYYAAPYYYGGPRYYGRGHWHHYHHHWR